MEKSLSKSGKSVSGSGKSVSESGKRTSDLFSGFSEWNDIARDRRGVTLEEPELDLLSDSILLYRNMIRFCQNRLKGTDLTLTEMMYLIYLFPRRNVLQDRLIWEMASDRAQVTRILQKLEQKGYVKRLDGLTSRDRGGAGGQA